MATIGLKDLYYAPITEDEDGTETFGTPKILSKAISAELSVEYAEGTLYADDALDENPKAFSSGTLTLGVKELGSEAAAALLGAKVDDNGVLVSSAEDVGQPVAIGFRALKADRKSYRYVWLYRVLFSVPSETYNTKADSFEFQTPEIEGTIMQRKTPDSRGEFNWKAAMDSNESGVDSATITGWFSKVYEPEFSEAGA